MLKDKKLFPLLSAMNQRGLSFAFGAIVLSSASVHSAHAQVLLQGAEAPAGTISGNVDIDNDGVYSEGTWSLVNTPAGAIKNIAFLPVGGVAMKYQQQGVYDINAQFDMTLNDPEMTYQFVAYGNEGRNGGYESRAASYKFSWVGGAGTAQVFDPVHDQIDDSATITAPNSITIFQNNPPPGQEDCAWKGDITRDWRNKCLEWYVVMPNGATSFTIDAVGGSASEGYRFSVVSYADIIVNKTVSAPTLKVGEAGFFTIDVTNNNTPGNSVSLGTSLTDLLPAGLTFTSSTIVTDGANSGGSYDDTTGEWDLGRLSVGETATLKINFTVDASAVNKTITNTIDPASIKSTQTDSVDNHVSLSASVDITEADTTSLNASKTVEIWDPSNIGLYALPGNDVIYTINVSNSGNTATDVDTIVLIDAMPNAVEFYNGDIDDAGPETDPVSFSQTGGTTLSFPYATSVKYSTGVTKPADFSACNYTPTTGYDGNVTFICINPKGVFAAGDPDPSFSVSFRAKIE